MKPVSKREVLSARLSRNLTQEKAGALIGYSRRAWQSWELGTRKMRRSLLELFIHKAKHTR